MDIADIASNLEIQATQQALQDAKDKPYEKRNRSSTCLYCHNSLDKHVINFCDSDCKSDYEYEQRIKRNQGLI